MATLATNAEKWLADEWEKEYNSAVLSGIVGDLAHKKRGGYHISRQDQPSTNYSVKRADDKVGPSDRSAAVDMTMNTSDMKKCHVRLRTVWKNRAIDPRMKYINAWNGWDGTGDAGRYDVITGDITTATPDHKWHIHLEIRRRYVNDMNAMKAILSILKGETLAEYQGIAIPAKIEGVETTVTKEEITAIAVAVHNMEIGRSGETIGQALDRLDKIQARLDAIYTVLVPEATTETPPTATK